MHSDVIDKRVLVFFLSNTDKPVLVVMNKTKSNSRRGSPDLAVRANAIGPGCETSTTVIIVSVVMVILVAIVISGIVMSVKTDAKYTTEPFSDNVSYQLVYLHMNGCSFCRKFDPIWAELKETHETEFGKMGVKMVNYESKTPQSAAFSPKGYPTILFADMNGKTIATFSGPRTVPALVTFVENHVPKK